MTNSNKARASFVICTMLGLSYALGVAMNEREEMLFRIEQHCETQIKNKHEFKRTPDVICEASTLQYVMNGE